MHLRKSRMPAITLKPLFNLVSCSGRTHGRIAMRSRKLAMSLVLAALTSVAFQPAPAHALNGSNHRDMVLRAFDIMGSEMGLGAVVDYYQSLPMDGVSVGLTSGGCFGFTPTNVAEAVACEALDADYYKDLSICDSDIISDDCYNSVNPGDWSLIDGAILLIAGESAGDFNFAGNLHFNNVRKAATYAWESRDGYYCDWAYSPAYETKSFPWPYSETWGLDALVCGWLGTDADVPGEEFDDSYLDMNVSRSPGLYRYLTPRPGFSPSDEALARYSGVSYSNAVFPPVSGMARYWYGRYRASFLPIYLGPVLHAVQDAAVPQHAAGYNGNWHASTENGLNDYFDAHNADADFVAEAVKEANLWIKGTPGPLLGGDMTEFVNLTAKSASDMMNPLPSTYTLSDATAKRLQTMALGRTIAVLYKGWADSTPDSDGDGVANAADNCPGKANSDQADNDSDWVGNACDNCPNFWNRDQSDIDGDGAGDLCDVCMTDPGAGFTDPAGDVDGDYIGGTCDNCPTVKNKDQHDIDNDGMGDVCDADMDNDGLANDEDNCARVPNAEQSDSDGDGVGTACDSCDNPYAYLCSLEHMFCHGLNCLQHARIPGIPADIWQPHDPSGWLHEATYGDVVTAASAQPGSPVLARTTTGYLTVSSFADPESPVVLGATYVGRSFAMDAFQNYAVVGVGSTLRLMGISNPADINVDASLSVGATILDVKVVAPFAYVLTSTEVLVVDLRAPKTLRIASRLTTGMSAPRAFTSNGRLILLAPSQNTMAVYSLATPTQPTRIGSVTTRAGAVDLTVNGNYVYVATSSGIQVIDTNLRSFREVGFVAVTSPRAVLFDGGGLLVGFSNTIHHYRLTQPSAPVLTSKVPQTGSVRSLSKHGDRVVVAEVGSAKVYRPSVTHGGPGYMMWRPFPAGDRNLITNVTFAEEMNLPAGTHVTRWVSADGGRTWGRVTHKHASLGARTPAAQVVLALVMGTSDSSVTPRVWNPNATYSTDQRVTNQAPVATYAPDYAALEAAIAQMERTVALDGINAVRAYAGMPGLQGMR